MKVRKIKNIFKGVQTSDGAGVNLTRIIGTSELDMLDPFLLLDEFGSDHPKDYIAGFPSHPHRGFETITYMLNGKFRHKDSNGNEGVLSDGSVQWMTAGRGVIHSEMPEQTEGLVRGFQLWLNLPKELKMIKPAYRDIPKDKIPQINFPGGEIKIIAGKYNDIKGPGRSHTEMFYHDVNLKHDANFNLPLIDGWNVFIYVYEGNIIMDRNVSKNNLAVLNDLGDLELSTEKNGSKFIVVGGKPLNESVARGGPFVMNTKKEVLQAFTDYQNGELVK
jgi:redox-sensitive bicupin YhaK (pirin superfamily)